MPVATASNEYTSKSEICTKRNERAYTSRLGSSRRGKAAEYSGPIVTRRTIKRSLSIEVD